MPTYVFNGSTWVLVDPDACPYTFTAVGGELIVATTQLLVTCPTVFVNKIIQVIDIDFTRSGDQEITFTVALNANDEVIIKN